MAKAAAAAVWCLVVVAAVAALVAAEADPGHHGVGGRRPYYKQPYYKRPSYYNQRQPQLAHGNLPHSDLSGAIGGHSLRRPSVPVPHGHHNTHSFDHHDTHSTFGHATGAQGLYPGLKEGYSFYDYKPSAGYNGCDHWCYSSGPKHYYCCYETHH